MYARRHQSIEEGRPIAITEAPAERYVGSRQKKHNGDLFLTGRASYFNDLIVPNMAYAAVLRSPHAHARIKKIDTGNAAKAPGVIATLTGREALDLAGPIPFFIDPAVFGGKTTEVRCLAVGKVVMVGQPVAAVVAESMNDAEAALDAIEVDYEVLEPVLDADEAMKEDSPRVYEDWDDNIVTTIPFVEGDVEAALAAADHVIEDEDPYPPALDPADRAPWNHGRVGTGRLADVLWVDPESASAAPASFTGAGCS